MVNGNIGMSDPRILDAIRKYNFGAVIEVTNGITDYKKRQYKKGQLKKIKRNLKKALGDSAHIVGGLALIKTEVPEIKELDFFMQIANYNMQNLECAVKNVLGTNIIGAKDKKFLRKLIGIAEENRYFTLRSLLNPTVSTMHHLPRTMRHTYDEDIAVIKGAVLEVYVNNLFAEAMTCKFEATMRNYIWDKEAANPERWHTEADIIIAAPEKSFRDALETIVERYDHGLPKITVSYPNGF